MKKKFKLKALSILMAVLMVATIIPMGAISSFAETNGGYEYSVISHSQKTVEITGYYGNGGDIVIPSKILGFTVTRISGDFKNVTNIISVIIPNSVTELGWTAFINCTGLTSVTIGDGVTGIGDHAFGGCTSLTAINVSEGNTVYSSIDGVVYSKDKTELLICPEGKSGELAIPNSVTSIGEFAFGGCTGLKDITIPSSVTSIGYAAFEGTPFYNSLPDGEVYLGKVLYAYKGTIPKNTKINIKPGTVSITDSVFSSCKDLTSVTIPGSLVSYNFSYCTGLKSVTIGDGVTSICGSAFDGCTGLTSVIVPNSVTSIGYCAFKGCTGLVSITIGNGVTDIGKRAFDGCTGLTSVIIPNSVTTIGEGAFYGCSGLKDITIPDSVTSIGGSAFDDTPFYNSLPDGEVYLGKVFYKYNGTMPANTEINIKSGTVSIAGYAFGGCAGLIGVTIPDSVTSIGINAFQNCTGLTSLIIPNSVTSINREVFLNCSSLTNVTIGNSVTSINEYAFAHCTSLTSITIGNSVTSIDNKAFYNCTGLVSITIGNGVTDIGYGAFEGTPFYNSLPDGEVYLGKVLYEYRGTTPKDTEIIVRPGTISITGGAFRGCTGLKGVTIPASVTSIGYGVFENCGKAFTITGSKGSAAEEYATVNEITFIDINTIHAENFDYRIISESNKTIEIVKFTGTDSEIIIPEIIDGYIVTKIADNAFANCTTLKSVTIPNSVTQIEKFAFVGCSIYFVIKALVGSAAEKYAQDNGFFFEAITAPTRILGDVTGNGKVTSADAIAVLRAEAQLRTLTAEEFTAADVVKDGRVTSGDAIKILRYEAQLIPSL